MSTSGHPQLGATVTHLRVRTTPALPDLPSADELLGWVGARRPGELHEALSLSRPAAQRLVAAAHDAGVSVDIAGTVLLEAGIVVNDAGVEAPAALTAAASSNGGVRRRLTAAESDYLRALGMRRRRPPTTAPPATLSLPVRMLGRLTGADVDATLGLVDIEIALTWETASLLSGRTMAEWAFYTLVSCSART
jgi:hypothetical protein